MKDQSRTKQELLEENAFLKQKIQELEHSESERKRAEDALRKSEKRFRELAELLPETVYETDIQGILTFVNRNAFDRFGYTQEDFEGGLNAFDVIIPDDRGQAFENFQRIVNGENIGSIEYTVQRKDGSTFPAMIHTSVIIHDGKPAGLRGFIVDITEQKMAEERFTRINACLLALGPDFDENVTRLTALCGELLGATCALYNRLESGMLCSIGQWHTPPDYVAEDKPDGHICYDVIRQGSDETLVVRNLSQTHYAATDPNVTKYGLRTYIGQVVRCAGEPVGSLCVVFQRDVEPMDDHKRILGIIASSLTSEEGRKRVEESLRKNRRQLTDIIDFLPDATFAIDKERRVIIWNKAIEKMTGIPATEMIGQGDYAYTIPFYGEARPQLMDLVFEHQEEIAARYPNITREGDTLMTEVFCNALNDNKGAWVFAKASPLHDQAGNIVGAIESIRDITERKRTEERICKMNIFLNSIVENIPNMLFLKGARDLRFVRFNRAGEDLLGYSRDDLLGKSDYDFFPKDQADFFTEKDREVLRGKVVVDIPEEPLQTRNKGERILHTKKVPILGANGEPEYLLGISEDITERKQMEDTLMLNAQRMQTLLQLNQMKEATLQEITDFVLEEAVRLTQSKIGYLAFLNENESILTMHSWSKDAMAECAIENKPIIYPIETTGLWGEAVRLRRPVITNDYTAASPLKKGYPEGHVVVKRHMNIPVFEDSRIVIIAGVGNKAEEYDQGDVQQLTLLMEGMWLQLERKRAEAEKVKLEEQHRHAQKMEAIGQLAGGIAHDFNNILSAIIGFTEVSIRNVPPGSKLEDNLQRVLNAGLRARDLVKQILAFSRQTDRVIKPVQVKPIVKEALKFIRASIPTTIEINQDIGSGSLILGDPTRVHQIIMNLCTNAAHAMQDTEGRMVVSLTDVELGADVTDLHPDMVPGPFIKLTVSDSGRGIAPEIRDRIFDPFFTTKGLGEGTGLGLSVVHGIVADSGGMVSVESMPGKGSTFNVFFPVIENEQGAEIFDRIPLPTGNERILFVDDEEQQVEMGKQVLKLLGYRVTTKTSSKEALEVFRAKPDEFDLVLTDLTMPKMTGDVLAKEIMAIRSDIPVILCTGYSEMITHAKAKAMGIKEVIMKPALVEEIARTVRMVLDQPLKK
ncbi:MAG: PAS domain S-box protein [Proteobacteria bacterium]|nr:PAS domain S-box protein [Pseudomonadota bacterium]